MDDSVRVWVIDMGDGTRVYRLYRPGDGDGGGAVLKGIPTASVHTPGYAYATCVPRAEWDVIATMGETLATGWIVVRHE